MLISNIKRSTPPILGLIRYKLTEESIAEYEKSNLIGLIDSELRLEYDLDMYIKLSWVKS
jgi:hypothetical protein